jgi:transcriptional regulator with XRE-family HTH domain
MKNFNEMVRDSRVRKGLSKSELARIIGVSPMTVCHYEKNNTHNHPSPERVVIIADVLGIERDKLIKANIRDRLKSYRRTLDSMLDKFEKRICDKYEDAIIKPIFKANL